MALEIVILAAGKGTRMNSMVPKVLHKLGGKSLLEHVVTAARQLRPAKIHVVYRGAVEPLAKDFANNGIHWVTQDEQLGTGDAVRRVLPWLNKSSIVLILYGDVPLISSKTLKKLIKKLSGNTLAILSAMLPDPKGFGRVVRNASGELAAIVEHSDATPQELAIREINSGVLVTTTEILSHYLPLLNDDNAKREHYLTDLVGLLIRDKLSVGSLIASNVWEIAGVNDRKQLMELERVYQRNIADRLMLGGVTLMDPLRFDLRGDLQTGLDVTIDVNVVIEGKVTLGDGAIVGQNSFLRDSKIGKYVTIKPNSIIEGATIGDHCTIGPFARIRPGTLLKNNARVGNFVEIKESSIGSDSKVNHLSYVGDSIVGNRVNIGAGTITCNYDGVNKHRTTIGDEAFVGSNTALVAPVKVGRGATIGAGSVITRHAPDHRLTLARAKQVTVADWSAKKHEEE